MFIALSLILRGTWAIESAILHAITGFYLLIKWRPTAAWIDGNNNIVQMPIFASISFKGSLPYLTQQGIISEQVVERVAPKMGDTRQRSSDRLLDCGIGIFFVILVTNDQYLEGNASLVVRGFGSNEKAGVPEFERNEVHFHNATPGIPRNDPTNRQLLSLSSSLTSSSLSISPSSRLTRGSNASASSNANLVGILGNAVSQTLSSLKSASTYSSIYVNANPFCPLCLNFR